MKVDEIVAQLTEANPKLFGNMPEKKAVRLVNAVLQHTAKQINSTDEGKVRIARLGTFNVKQREQEKEGVKKTVKRVSFTAAKNKAKNKAQDKE